jgi:hypothetical protein
MLGRGSLFWHAIGKALSKIPRWEWRRIIDDDKDASLWS